MRCMVLSALGFFFAGGIDNAYAVSAAPVPVMMAPPEHAVQHGAWHVRPCGRTGGLWSVAPPSGRSTRQGTA